MRIKVKAKPKSKFEHIEKLNQDSLPLFDKEMDVYKVSVKEPAVDGRANESIIKVIAKHFGISTSFVNLISGHTSKNKIFEIMK